MINERFLEYANSIPLARGVLEANVAVLAAGTVAILAAASLNKVEYRLKQLESDRAAGLH